MMSAEPTTSDPRIGRDMLRTFLRSRLLHRAVGVLLATQVLFFAWRHVEAFLVTGTYAILLFCVSETLQAALYLLRRLPQSVSQDPFDWVVAIGGTMGPLFFIPGGSIVWAYGAHLIFLGVVLQILALLSLGRSFAIVAANRTIKTAGMYRLVRHPMYASYIPLFVGYVLLNASLFNLALVVMVFGLIVLRIMVEESHLASDPAYREYMKHTRWRILPPVL